MERLTEQMIQAIRDEALRTEKTKRLQPQVLELIYEQKWFKLFVPEELGGRMVSLPEAVRIFARTSWMDGSLGWVVTIGSGGGFFVPFLPKEARESLFAAKEAVVAGSGHPSGTAKPVEGGYIVNGTWKYCSGSSYATVFTANCMIEADEPGQEPHIRAVALRPDQVTIVHDWNAVGLKATESNTMVVKDAFVPHERTFTLVEPLAYTDEPLYRYPFIPFAQASFAAVGVGICRRFLEEAKQLVERSSAGWQTTNPQRASVVMDRIREAEMLFEQSAQAFFTQVDHSWDVQVKEGTLPEGVEQEVSRQCKETARAALTCANGLLPSLGLQAMLEETPLNQAWRDLNTACQHSLLLSFAE
ncbi:acyl-CoA dehydrogenase [Brevibacillus fluminis]|uniref:acyl-CoA dehydrogenase n=1 Tax=Brevibacillus fluminis TaxID=511487 RepID=UPI003F8AFA34